MKVDLGIKASTSICGAVNRWNSSSHFLVKKDNTWQGILSSEHEQELDILRNSNKNYKLLDKSVLLAMLAAKKTIQKTNWKSGTFGVMVGSSRGAAHTLEQAHSAYLSSNQVHALTSPLTTSGNLAFWTAQHTKSNAFHTSSSITCSSALHALLHAASVIEAGWQTRFLVGGTEAPLTPFFIEQMKALRIYAPEHDTEYPNQSLNLNKKYNTMILGEGAGILALEKPQEGQHYNARVIGLGVGSEPIQHHTSMTETGENVMTSMHEALSGHDVSSVDVVVMHAPGTKLGDVAEHKAVKKIFSPKLPVLTSNKWQIGHTLGASGAISIDFALSMFNSQQVFRAPFLSSPSTIAPKRILVNAMGFGGNAVSVLLEKGN